MEGEGFGKAAAMEREIFGDEDDLLSDLEDNEEFFLDDDQELAPLAAATVATSDEEEAKSKKKQKPSVAEKPLAEDGAAVIRHVIKKGRLDRKQRRTAEDKPRRKRRERVARESDDEDEDRDRVGEEPVNPNLAEFDAAIKAQKSGRKRRVDLQDEAEADEMIIRLCGKMRDALEEDLEANYLKQPAIAKLRLLPQVTSLLEKSYLHEQILDHELLSLMRQWLEPHADGSLPSLDIRRSFVDALFKLPITSDHLRESRIGRVIMFMYKCEKELPEVRKKCGDLIGLWSRPFLNSRQPASSMSTASQRAGPPSMPELSDPNRIRVGDPGYITKHAQIPKAALVEYAAPPPSSVQLGESQNSSAASRYRRLANSLGRAKSKTESRLNKVSVEGRGL